MLKGIYRSFQRSPLLTSLNVLGLSIGLGSFLVITLFLFQENSYEKNVQDYERIYRVEETFMNMGRVASTSPNLPHSLADFAQIELQTRVGRLGAETKVIIGEQTFAVKKAMLADSAFFKLFGHQFIAKSSETVLAQPREMVLSEKTAMKFFGRTDVLGEVVRFLDFPPHKVVGVIKDDKLKSHLDFDLVISSRKTVYEPNRWWGLSGYSYVKLTQGTSPEALTDELDRLVEKEVFPVLNAGYQMPFEEWIESINKMEFHVKPIRDIYLNSNLDFEISQNGDRQTRITLTIIAVFILLVASINFMNLTTANSSKRTKEIGVRKVLGATKQALVKYFLIEAVIITFIATLLGAGMSELFIGLINQSLGEVIGVSLVNYPVLLIYLALFVLVLGIMSGIYPAFFLASAKMIPLLKGMKINRVLNLNGAKLLRNGLVVTQFAISSTLIIASVLIYNQLRHLQNVNLGFAQDQVVIIKQTYPLKDAKSALRNELLRLPSVVDASFTHKLPGDGTDATTSVNLDEDRALTLTHFYTDEYLDDALGLNVTDGTWFDPEKNQYDSLIVINNAAAQALGYEDPIGQIFGDYWTIIGVVDDFYFDGLRDEIGPAMFIYSQANQTNLAVRFRPDAFSIGDVEEVWTEFTKIPFEYYYLDQNFERQLVKEGQNANAVLIFTALAILISCLGLFGLAAFTADQRLHEFGIRKVLGANVQDIIKVFSFDFVKLIILAFFISIPLAFYGVDLWLNGFANRISISISPFILSGVLSIGIAMITILFQCIKTGRINPTDTLRNE
ncbi:FtsX-like permease family protein [Roseivirga misakiensis]|uniref:Cell division protein FtsX n=1 Tax=Roseivirga misakiensis TaxID=1563681 RepID=A0A1E5SYH6_9BACT|nr:FtsX-like permease family protein [Roseivirga misakiensis]OEK04184.1 hypothetical protein BFP71_11920 [Roseivirga misakiensis]